MPFLNDFIMHFCRFLMATEQKDLNDQDRLEGLRVGERERGGKIFAFFVNSVHILCERQESTNSQLIRDSLFVKVIYFLGGGNTS